MVAIMVVTASRDSSMVRVTHDKNTCSSWVRATSGSNSVIDRRTPLLPPENWPSFLSAASTYTQSAPASLMACTCLSPKSMAISLARLNFFAGTVAV